MFIWGLWLSVWKKCSSGTLISFIQSSRSCALESLTVNSTNSRVTATCVEPLAMSKPWGAGSLRGPRCSCSIHENWNQSGKKCLCVKKVQNNAHVLNSGHIVTPNIFVFHVADVINVLVDWDCSKAHLCMLLFFFCLHGRLRYIYATRELRYAAIANTFVVDISARASRSCFLQRVRIARNADRRTNETISVRLSVRSLFRHVLVLCPDEWRYDRVVLACSTVLLVSEEVKFIRMFAQITPSKGVKVKHPLSLAKIWPIIGHNLETVQDTINH